MRVDVEDGKYTVVFEDGRLYALRNGEEWRDCVGDKLIYALAAEVERLRKVVGKMRAVIVGTENALRAVVEQEQSGPVYDTSKVTITIQQAIALLRKQMETHL